MEPKALYKKNQIVTYKGKLHRIERSSRVDPILWSTYFAYEISPVKRTYDSRVLYRIEESKILPVTGKEYKKLCEIEKIPKWMR